MKLRFQPIRVLCFHQTSAEFDASTMWECDWTEIGQFKSNILKLMSEYTFISLPEAYEKLKNDAFRVKKYAVLTCDDGWKSILNILPWLDMQHVPVTLFLNPAYLLNRELHADGKNDLLRESDLRSLLQKYNNVTIASHGWTHELVSEQTPEQFEKSVLETVKHLSNYEQFISFHAYTCGRYTLNSNQILQSHDLIPLYCDGMYNIKFAGIIHRECIDAIVL